MNISSTQKIFGDVNLQKLSDRFIEKFGRPYKMDKDNLQNTDIGKQDFYFIWGAPVSKDNCCEILVIVKREFTKTPSRTTGDEDIWTVVKVRIYNWERKQNNDLEYEKAQEQAIETLENKVKM